MEHRSVCNAKLRFHPSATSFLVRRVVFHSSSFRFVHAPKILFAPIGRFPRSSFLPWTTLSSNRRPICRHVVPPMHLAHLLVLSILVVVCCFRFPSFLLDVGLPCSSHVFVRRLCFGIPTSTNQFKVEACRVSPLFSLGLRTHLFSSSGVMGSVLVCTHVCLFFSAFFSQVHHHPRVLPLFHVSLLSFPSRLRSNAASNCLAPPRRMNGQEWPWPRSIGAPRDPVPGPTVFAVHGRSTGAREGREGVDRVGLKGR